MKIIKYTKYGKTRYRFQIRLGDDVTTRSGFKTQNEAIFAYTQLIEKYQEELDENEKYHVIYENWLKIYKTQVKESTYQACTSIYRLHILPTFGDIKINKITPLMCPLLVG